MQTIGKLTRSAIRQIDETGGFTVDVDGNPPTDGYMVGVPAYESVILDHTATYGDVWDYIATRLLALSSGFYLGGWTDSETGKTYLDVAQRYSDRETALAVARDRAELAIWDVAAVDEIRV